MQLPFALPQKPKFVEYIYYPSLMIEHELKQIQGLWNADEILKAQVTNDSGYDDNLRQGSIMAINRSNLSDWLYQRLGQVAIGANNEFYQFDLSGLGEPLQLARYGVGDFFDWHMDFGPGVNSTRKLSISVQLSDPDTYEGGDLQFMINQKVITAPREKGTVIVFPSFILHRVTEITKGTRESIVSWVSGPALR